MKVQRDHALSLLAEADSKIVELTIELNRLRAEQPAQNVTPIGAPGGRRN